MTDPRQRSRKKKKKQPVLPASGDILRGGGKAPRTHRPSGSLDRGRQNATMHAGSALSAATVGFIAVDAMAVPRLPHLGTCTVEACVKLRHTEHAGGTLHAARRREVAFHCMGHWTDVHNDGTVARLDVYAKNVRQGLLDERSRVAFDAKRQQRPDVECYMRASGVPHVATAYVCINLPCWGQELMVAFRKVAVRLGRLLQQQRPSMAVTVVVLPAFEGDTWSVVTPALPHPSATGQDSLLYHGPKHTLTASWLSTEK